MILVGIGSNLSFCGATPYAVVKMSVRALSQIGQVRATSRFYRTPAWPNPDDPEYINAAVSLSTDLRPARLLSLLHQIEAAFGRKRGAKNGPRTLDLDLLGYDDVSIPGGKADGLVLPHPRLHAREFVLRPLADIAPDWTPPESKKTVATLLEELGVEDAIPLKIRGGDETDAAARRWSL